MPAIIPRSTRTRSGSRRDNGRRGHRAPVSLGFLYPGDTDKYGNILVDETAPGTKGWLVLKDPRISAQTSSWHRASNLLPDPIYFGQWLAVDASPWASATPAASLYPRARSTRFEAANTSPNAKVYSWVPPLEGTSHVLCVIVEQGDNATSSFGVYDPDAAAWDVLVSYDWSSEGFTISNGNALATGSHVLRASGPNSGALAVLWVSFQPSQSNDRQVTLHPVGTAQVADHAFVHGAYLYSDAPASEVEVTSGDIWANIWANIWADIWGAATYTDYDVWGNIWGNIWGDIWMSSGGGEVTGSPGEVRNLELSSAAPDTTMAPLFIPTLDEPRERGAFMNELPYSTEFDGAQWSGDADWTIAEGACIVPGKKSGLHTYAAGGSTAERFQIDNYAEGFDAGDCIAYAVIESNDVAESWLYLTDPGSDRTGARVRYEWEPDSVSLDLDDLDDVEYGSKVLDESPNGGTTVLIWVSASVPSGYSRDVHLYPVGMGDQSGKSAYVHHAGLAPGRDTPKRFVPTDSTPGYLYSRRNLLHRSADIDDTSSPWEDAANWELTEGPHALFPGQTPWRHKNDGGGTNRSRSQVRGTFSAQPETVAFLLENVNASVSEIGLRDDTAAAWVALVSYDWDTDSTSLVDSAAGSSVSHGVIDLGGHRRLIWVTATATNPGNTRRVSARLTGPSINTDTVIAHYAGLFTDDSVDLHHRYLGIRGTQRNWAPAGLDDDGNLILV